MTKKCCGHIINTLDHFIQVCLTKTQKNTDQSKNTEIEYA